MHLTLELGLPYPKGQNTIENIFSLVQMAEPIWNLVWDIANSNVDRTGVNVDFKPPLAITHFNSLVGDLPEIEVIELLSQVKAGALMHSH